MPLRALFTYTLLHKMSGPPPPGGFNPGAYEFRPGQGQPFVPRGAPGQPQQGQPGQAAYDPYGAQQYGQYGGYQQQGYGGYPGQQQQQYAYGGAQQQYYPQQAAAPAQPSQRAFVPGQKQTFVPGQRPVQGFQPPTVKPVSLGETKAAPASLSIGGGAKAAPSLSIGGASKAAPSLSIGGAKAAPSLSIGGASKAAPSLSIGGSKPAKKEEQVEEKAAEVKEEKEEVKAEEQPEQKPEVAEEEKVEEPKETKKAEQPAPAATEAGASNTTPSKAAKSTTNFSKVSAKTDADAVYKEQAAAGVEAMRDLYGDDASNAGLKTHLNIMFAGHVDAGKSTLGGQLLVLTGAVDKRTMEKIEQEAKAAGRDGWALSWALDSGKDERAKGKTVEVGRGYFETDQRRYTILDAPGHKTYVPSMITGAAQADVAMLVLSARKGEFETGFEREGQTREHAVLIKNNGINKLVLVVNKMDDPTVQWDQGRYDEIKGKITPFLKALGFNPKTDLTFIPVSAQMGENMKEPIGKKVAPWYE